MRRREPTDDGAAPHVAAVLTMFYYQDVDRAAAWYEDKLGFRRLMQTTGFVLFEVSGVAQLALIGAGHGSQQPIAGSGKGAILSIETEDLEGWHALLFAREVEGTGTGLQVGGGGRTVEFKVQDPEGYTIEFFEWI